MIDVNEYVSSISAPPIGPGNLFNGDHVAFINGKAANPKLTGYGVVKWIHLPPWLDTTFPWYREAFEKNVLSFGGISDIALNNVELALGGFTGETTNIAGNIAKGNKEVTVGYKEFVTDPMSKVYEFWISMIRDPNTGVSQYPSITWGSGRNYEYKEENHTGALLYAVLKPDVVNVDVDDISMSSITRAYLWTNVKPQNIMLASENFQSGTVDQVEYEESFVGDFHMNTAITKEAPRYLRSHSLIRDLADGAANINPINFSLGSSQQVAEQ